MTVAEALRACGETVELMEDHFDPDTADVIWAPQIGARRWIILSKDSRMRHNHIELAALLKANTHSFILTAQNQSGADMAAAFTAALQDMKQMVARFPAPLIATVSRAGNVKVYLTRDKLIGRVAENAASAEKLKKYEATTAKKRR